MADANSAEYWKARAEAAWEREDVDGLTLIQLRGENSRQQVRIAELETLANEALNRLEESIDNTPDSRFIDRRRTRAWLEAARKVLKGR